MRRENFLSTLRRTSVKLNTIYIACMTMAIHRRTVNEFIDDRFLHRHIRGVLTEVIDCAASVPAVLDQKEQRQLILKMITEKTMRIIPHASTCALHKSWRIDPSGSLSKWMSCPGGEVLLPSWVSVTCARESFIILTQRRRFSGESSSRTSEVWSLLPRKVIRINSENLFNFEC